MTGNESCSCENRCAIELECSTSVATRNSCRYVHCKGNWILQKISPFATSHLMPLVTKTAQAVLSKAVYVSLLTVVSEVNEATSSCQSL